MRADGNCWSTCLACKSVTSGSNCRSEADLETNRHGLGPGCFWEPFEYIVILLLLLLWYVNYLKLGYIVSQYGHGLLPARGISKGGSKSRAASGSRPIMDVWSTQVGASDDRAFVALVLFYSLGKYYCHYSCSLGILRSLFLSEISTYHMPCRRKNPTCAWLRWWTSTSLTSWSWPPRRRAALRARSYCYHHQLLVWYVFSYC